MEKLSAPIFTKNHAKQVIDALQSGVPLKMSMKQLGFTSLSPFYSALKSDPQLNDSFTIARQNAAHTFANDTIYIADDHTLPPEDRALAVKTRQWLASRYNREDYGDTTTLRGDKNNPLFNIATSLEQARKKLEQLKNPALEQTNAALEFLALTAQSTHQESPEDLL